MAELDLYEDLGAIPNQESYHDIKEERDRLRRENAALKAQNERLAKENKLLRTQNTAMKRNISCLFKTAKLEIDRKDRMLAEHRQSSLRGTRPAGAASARSSSAKSSGTSSAPQ